VQTSTALTWVLVFTKGLLVAQPGNRGAFKPDIPKTWDDQAIASIEVPLANPRGSPKHVTAEYYYRISVRPIFRSYPIYAPGRGPAGYIEWLKQQEPQVLWDDQTQRPPLETESDWRKAGELVFESPFLFEQLLTADEAQNPDWYKHVDPPLTRDGIVPFVSYVIRKKGQVEVGSFGCWTCHTRVMPDGSLIKGAQGNFGVQQSEAYRFRHRVTPEFSRVLVRGLFAVPWQNPDPHSELEKMTPADIAGLYDSMPPGVIARGRTSPLFPVQVSDLIGVQHRRYLDHTGLQVNRGLADLMRYAALNQGMDDLASFDGFVPRGDPASSRPPARSPFTRYSDEQLYALALYLSSLQPPANPNPFDEVAARGKKVFEREGCAGCHAPPLYTNNELTLADGFKPSDDEIRKYEIQQISVGTDPRLALQTRRGTGFYKVPSLTGVWYRSMFGHGGWCASLEDWFDVQRLNDGYRPTGFHGVGPKSHPVKGHRFGLTLSSQDRQSLIQFLKTL
jgi:hypothetical protein